MKTRNASQTLPQDWQDYAVNHIVVCVLHYVRTNKEQCYAFMKSYVSNK
jgi:hypothetical protein